MFCKYTKKLRIHHKVNVQWKEVWGEGGAGWSWVDRLSKIWGFIQVTEKHLYINTSKITKLF